MKYDFECESCGHVHEQSLSMDAFKTVKEEGVDCPECGEHAVYKFNPGSVTIGFAGDAWADKNHREKAYRKRRSSYMEKRMRTNHKTPELVPNYGGEEAGSWEEARDAAVEAGKSGLTYEPLIQRERIRK